MFLSGAVGTAISSIPILNDAVYVGECKDVKIKNADILYAVGLNGEVPFSKSDTSILTDSDLYELDSFKVIVEPKLKIINLRERENVCLSLISFNQKLKLSYSNVSPNGKEVLKSELINYITNLFKIKPLRYISNNLLNDFEFAFMSRDNIEFYDKDLNRINKEVKNITVEDLVKKDEIVKATVLYRELHKSTLKEASEFVEKLNNGTTYKIEIKEKPKKFGIGFYFILFGLIFFLIGYFCGIGQIQKDKDIKISVDYEEQTFRTSKGFKIYPIRYKGQLYVPYNGLGSFLNYMTIENQETGDINLITLEEDVDLKPLKDMKTEDYNGENIDSSVFNNKIG